MGDLSKELLKAGLISEKQFRQTQHQERVKKTEVGHEGLDREAEAKRAADDRRREEQRRKDQARVREEQAAVQVEVTRARLKDLIRGGAVRAGASGNRKFYFVTPAGRIPYLEVNEEAARALQHGDLAIVRVPDMKLERHVLLPERLAVQVHAVAPELVVLFRGKNAPGAIFSDRPA
ncbi:MAG: DUF2058 family protein [Planctomycetes bacterium]|nr:DUF2058 family protein [Planctomycetota bacterium]